MRGLLFVVLVACSSRSPAPDAGLRPRPAEPLAPPLAFGKLFPTVLVGVDLGMSSAALRAERPKAYESRANPQVVHEELFRNLFAHYTFHAGRLYSVLLQKIDAASEAAPLAAEARRRFGEPVKFRGVPLFRAPGSLLRIEADLGNLIVEYTEDSRSAAKK
jgi:hypothetical protein